MVLNIKKNKNSSNSNNNNNNNRNGNNANGNSNNANAKSKTGLQHPMLQVFLICILLKLLMLYLDQQQQKLSLLDDSTAAATAAAAAAATTSTELLDAPTTTTRVSSSKSSAANSNYNDFNYDDSYSNELNDALNMTDYIQQGNWPLIIEACNKSDPQINNKLRLEQQIKLPRLIYYHIQHHAGTNLWSIAKRNGECAPQACRQNHKQCFVSFTESKEARNLLQTELTYISYEARLPKHFPLPFVNPIIRKDFYFVTIIRNPFDRMLSTLSHLYGQFNDRKTSEENERIQISQFWRSMNSKSLDDPYIGDNLMVRWLAGIDSSDKTLGQYDIISQNDINIAKCRLDLFDLVMTDQTINLGIENILCPLRGWTNCHGKSSARSRNYTHEPFGIQNPILNKERFYLGAWIERHKPSFELYDYSKKLTIKTFTKQLDQLIHNTKLSQDKKDEIIQQLAEFGKRKSYVETLERYGINLPKKSGGDGFQGYVNKHNIEMNNVEGSSIDCTIIQQQYWTRRPRSDNDDYDSDLEWIKQRQRQRQQGDNDKDNNNDFKPKPIIYDDVPNIFGIQALSKKIKVEVQQQQQ